MKEEMFYAPGDSNSMQSHIVEEEENHRGNIRQNLRHYAQQNRYSDCPSM
jgi:hypothetical protein